jgi:uncharacterized protein (TIGR03437 family)
VLLGLLASPGTHMTVKLYRLLIAISLAAVTAGLPARAQTIFSNSPTRVLGALGLEYKSSTSVPNLVVGREFSTPQAVAVDTSTTPNRLYVVDTGNHRVLAWANASDFYDGQLADLVIGQRDLDYTETLGPGTDISGGLNSPTGIAVDESGNVYVADSGNNRVLRFSRPFDQPDKLKLPDLVFGQTSLTGRNANLGSNEISSRGLRLNFYNDRACSTCYRAGLALQKDGGRTVLWVVDAGNNRVLRFPVGNANGPSADLVLGQTDFNLALPINFNDPSIFSRRFATPNSVAVDSAGRVFVSDGGHRVLVFQPPFGNGQAAVRQIGGNAPPQGQSATAETLREPSDIVFINDSIYVADTGNNRIMVFPPFGQWPATGLPSATSVIAQSNFGTITAHRGSPRPGPNGLRRPTGMAAIGDTLFVVDSANHRMLQWPAPYQTANKVLGQNGFVYGGVNLAEGREFFFSSAAGIAVDHVSATPYLYVADALNHRVLGFRDVRRFQNGATADLVLGQPDVFTTVVNFPFNDIEQPSATGLAAPSGLAVDDEGNLWVVDRGNGRVLRFPRPFERAGLQEADLVIGQLSLTSKNLDPTSRTMRAPTGILFTNDGHLLVSDPGLNRVLFFNKPFASGMTAARVVGQPNFNTSASGAADNRMNAPQHIAMDVDDRLYVADTGNHRILIFNRISSAPNEPTPTLVLRDANSQGNRLNQPLAVFVHRPTGEIFVGDSGNNRILRYPRFDNLVLTPYSQGTQIPSAAPLGLSIDRYGNMIVADSLHRLLFYYPALAPVNGANFLANRELAPAMIASLFPFGSARFGEQTAGAAALPLPRQLGDIEVLVNGTAAPLLYVSPAQINLMMPNSTPTSGTVLVEVTRKSTGQTLASIIYPVSEASPGFFTVSQTGQGQIAALNEDNTPNSEQNPIAWGRVIQLFGTGAGLLPGGPADGVAPTGAVPTPEAPVIFLGSRNLQFDDAKWVEYSGLAPNFVGLWQINIRIPNWVAPGPRVPLIIFNYKGKVSDVSTSIAVKQN